VGADGAWSRVRPLVSPATPIYSGIYFVEITIRENVASRPEIAKLVGRGTMFATSDNKCIIAQRNSNCVRIYLGLRTHENWANDCGIDFNVAAKARPFLLALFEDWHPDLKNLIVVCEDEFLVRPLYALPVGHKWEPRKHITLLGDAAHLMAPFSGEGVNLAMQDSLELGLAIANHPEDLATAIAAYEKDLFPRSEIIAAKSSRYKDIMIAADAPAGLLNLFKEFAAKAAAQSPP